MREQSSHEAHIAEAWTPFAENTVGGYPASTFIEAMAQAQQPREDPWVSLINRFWETNPLSAVVPIDVGEILNVFQKVWLDAARNPMRSWGLCSTKSL